MSFLFPLFKLHVSISPEKILPSKLRIYANFEEKADLYYRLERLLSEKKMGSLFKVIFASKNKTNFNLGFK